MAALAVMGGAGCTYLAPYPERVLQTQWRDAATRGDAQAQYELGKSYCCGWGAGRTDARAVYWFCKAALQNHPLAQYELGRFFGARADTHAGLDLRQDLMFGYMWYSLAALQEVHLAAAEREALARDMTAQELVQARKYLNDWQQFGCPKNEFWGF